ncbi:MAG: peptidoglycan endopeptidase [Chthoniobacteraceae bacterium]|nr:peptidoglycan endopeptidase [Chthoniobacteraceae bacterium]
MLSFRFSLGAFATLTLAAFFSGCGGPAPYHYTYVPGKTAVVQGGRAVAPPAAPAPVKAAIEAGNQIAGLPYRRGGGHGRMYDSAYDCSGASSFVLREAGLLGTTMPSTAFREYGKGGEGDWISVYARKGHVFLVVAGLRFDTGYGRGAEGPQWTTLGRPTDGCVIRHPQGF